MLARRSGGVAVVVVLLMPLGMAVGSGIAQAPQVESSARAEVIRFGSTWRFRSGASPDASWKYSRQQWESGEAPFGAGDPGAGNTATTIGDGHVPVTTYFQRSFGLETVPDAGLEFTTRADDGLVAFVNGTEIARANLPTGEISSTTKATAEPDSPDASVIRFAVPASVLDRGTNVIAVEVHAGSSTTADLTFDASISAVHASATPPAPGYLAGWGAPRWNDDFTYLDPQTGRPAVDPSKWNVRGRDDLGLLPDAAVPDRDQVTVDSSGVAHLRAEWLAEPVVRAKDKDGPRELWHRTAYLDQRVLEKGDASYEQRYGRWEIRAKVPSGPRTYGALAAFWLRNDESGEIDIMEAWGYNLIGKNRQRVDTATTTIHSNASGRRGTVYAWTQSDYGAEVPVWNDFHTWAFELTPTYAAVYVDDARLIRVTPTTHPMLWDDRYFASPLHVRLNLHVGPSEKFWGLPDPRHRSWTTDLDFQVDYVRIWKYIGD